MQDAEEYYRRTLSAKYLPINPDSKTPSVDKAIRLTGLVVDRMRVWESPINSQKSLRELFKVETDFFDDYDADKNRDFKKMTESEFDDWYYGEPHKPKWYFLTLEIDNELRAVFHNRNESVLQNRDANYLIDYAVNLFLPTYLFEYDHHFTKWEWDAQSKKVMRIPVNHVFSGDEIDSVECDNVFFRSNVIQALHSWAKKITDYVSMYAPEIFEKHREQIEFYFRLGEPAPKQPQPTKPGVKLHWNGDKTDLAELVWALVKSGHIIDTNTNKPVIIDQLTRQFETLFDIEKLDVDGLVSKRILNTSKPTDNKTFLDTLQRLMQERIARSAKK